MRRIRIDLAYDGGPFHGFARQPDPHIFTVQGTLEGALSRLTGIDPSTTCAGRTDRGVHALAQVVHVDLDDTLGRVQRFLDDLDHTRARIDKMVGEAITVWGVTEVGPDFDARFSAYERAYRYRIVDEARPDPRLRRLRWHVGAPLDEAAMHRAAQQLLGEHDFAALCRKAPGKHTVRRIDEIAVTRIAPDPVHGEELHLTLRGPAFCHQMVRSIAGVLVEVGRGRRPEPWVAELLAGQDRSRAPAVAPPHALTLERVRYGDPWEDAPPHAG